VLFSREKTVGYHCVVCVKQVPDTSNITGDVMRPDGTVSRAAMPAIFNPEDLNALEAALAVKDRYGATVTVVTMGPPNACEILRESLYRHADRVILITDRRAAASDTLATSYILSRAIKTIGDFDIVFCGRQAIDGDTAQVGPQLAEKLGIPQATYFQRFESLGEGKARVRRDVGNGWEVLESPIPMLVTVLDTANEPRPAAARRVMQCKHATAPVELAKRIEKEMAGASDEDREAEHARRIEFLKMNGLLMEQWDLDHIKADLQWCGLTGSPTKVHRVQSIVLTKDGYTEVEPTDQGIRGMIHELIEDHALA